MGQEIEESRFTPEDFVDYAKCLRRETELLEQWFRDDQFSPRDRMGGFELEAWLLDHNYYPLPRNDEYLQRLNYPLVVPELSRFNIELNGTPREVDVPDTSTPLLYVLRNDLGLKGARFGCGSGQCGACAGLFSWFSSGRRVAAPAPRGGLPPPPRGTRNGRAGRRRGAWLGGRPGSAG